MTLAGGLCSYGTLYASGGGSSPSATNPAPGSVQGPGPPGPYPWPAWPPVGPPGGSAFVVGAAGAPSASFVSGRLDTPQLPQLGRRRSSVLAGLGSLGSHRGHHGPGGHPAAPDTGVSRRRSVAKQRRDDQTTPDVGTPEGPSGTGPTSTRSSALFSPYSPLPAIGNVASASATAGSMRSDHPHGAPGLPQGPQGPTGPTRLLRERTYDVLEPRFVRGPVPADPAPAAPVPPLAVHGRDASPLSSTSTGGMIEDEELPTSPPGIDDEDFSGSADLVVASSSASATPDGEDEGSTGSALGLGPLGDSSLGSRSLHALKEGYKGRLKKFWSKF